MPSATSSAEAAPAAKPRAWPGIIAGVIVIAAAALCFLTIAKFALFKFAFAIVDSTRITPLLAALALAGVLGTGAAAAAFAPSRARWLLALGFAGCLGAAVFTLNITREPPLLGAAALIGISLGWTLTIVALCLRPVVHLSRLGLWSGLGVGIAYAVSSQPLLFEGSHQDQLLVGCVAAGCGFVASWWMRSPGGHASSSPDYLWPGPIPWIVFALVFVFFDAVAFYIIQRSPYLAMRSWDSGLVLQGHAFLHLCAAVLAGIALDRRRPASTLAVALVLVLACCWIIGNGPRKFPQARVLHVAGVSVYSTLLLYMIARGARRWFAIAVLGPGVWIAPAVAISIAFTQKAIRVPPVVVLAGIGLGLSAFLARELWLRRSSNAG
jgi:hypothetical protein